MLKLTAAAAEQVKKAAEESQSEQLSLRVAASQNPDGTLNYGMGFDEATEDDVILRCEGIEVIVSPQHEQLLQGAVLDYVEMEPGQYHFIFLNPNDANYAPPGGSEPAGTAH